jgi:hypothetical protein
MSDYLWDKSGEPDPEVERFEKLLRPLAHRPLPLRPLRQPRRRARVWLVGAALAAAALLALLTARVWRPRPSPTIVERPPAVAPRPSWAAVVTGEGATVDAQPIVGEARLPVGAWLETGAARARLTITGVGSLDIGPGTRARIVTTGPAVDELALARGTLAAEVHAPPRHFVVSTPHVRAVDLGCAFTLTVDGAGQGQLVVTAGSVALADGHAREVVVPAGSTCGFAAGGAGTPVRVATAPGPASPQLPPPSPQSPSPPSPAPQLGGRDATEKAAPRPQVKRKQVTAKKRDKVAVPPATVPTQHTPAQPAKRAEPTKINHDALKGLERSIP